MTKRIKPTTSVAVINSLEEADSTLARIAGIKRHIGLIEAALNEDIDAAKLKAAEAAEPMRQEVAVLEQSLVRFADYRKDGLFKARKSQVLTFGTIGYRSSSKCKLLNNKHTWERVLQRLRDEGLASCIRIKEEPDKEALKALSTERLQALGCKVVQEDTFFYELSEQALGDSGGEAA